MINVCLVFGGMSEEHGISCTSASNIAENLNPEKYNVYKIGITKDGVWKLFDGEAEKMRDGTWFDESLPSCIISPDRSHKGIIADGKLIHIDVIFPALHGKLGEDGCIQGLFELSGIPYVGCGVAASALGMDKILSKLAYDAGGLLQADWVYFEDINAVSHDDAADTVEAKFGYPVFVKPANTGSSIGITKAHDRAELKAAFSLAATIDKKVLVEEFISGREVECAVMGNEIPIASAVGEVLSAGEFYDFDSKYVDAESKTAIPAQLPKEISEKVREAAVKAYTAIGAKGLSRADFFVTDDGRVLVNELNTLPGFTSISMYPKLWIHGGYSYAELLDRLIELAKTEK